MKDSDDGFFFRPKICTWKDTKGKTEILVCKCIQNRSMDLKKVSGKRIKWA